MSNADKRKQVADSDGREVNGVEEIYGGLPWLSGE